MRTAIFLLITIFCTFQTSALPETSVNSLSAESSYEPTTLKPYKEDALNETGKGMEDAMPPGGKKGKENGLEKMYMIFMMCKTLISTLLMFVSPVIQIKSFGLAVIGTILNIARFVYQLKNNNKSNKSAAMPPTGWASGLHMEDDPWSNGDRVGIAYSPSFRPTYFSHYPNYVHKYHVKS